jgi:hypothetical protein
MLSKDQRLDIVNSRINILEGYIYNLELAILEEESKSQPIQLVIDELNTQKSDFALALEALSEKLSILLAE